YEQLVRPDTTDEDVKLLTKKLSPGLGGYAVMIVLGIFQPVAAVLGYLAVAVFYLVPFSSFRRHSRRDQGARASQPAEAPRSEEKPIGCQVSASVSSGPASGRTGRARKLGSTKRDLPLRHLWGMSCRNCSCSRPPPSVGCWSIARCNRARPSRTCGLRRLTR